MTTPRTPEGGGALGSRRRSASSAPQPFTDAEVARGQSDALLGALGRMQLKLDVLAREQQEALSRVEALLERLVAERSERSLTSESQRTHAVVGEDLPQVRTTEPAQD